MSKKQEVHGRDGIYRSPRPPISLPQDPKFSMIPFLFRNLSSISNSPALVDAETAETLTFSNLETRVSRLSLALLNLNISKNDVVLILSPNSIHFPIAFLAVVAVGAVATTANPQYTTAELSKQIKDSNPKLIITVPELHDKIKQFNLPCIMLTDHNPRYINDSDTIESSSNESLIPAVMQTDAAAIMYSSGTTGASKGALLTHKNFMWSALMMTSDQESNGELGNVFLCFLPMFHIFGLSGLLYAQLQRGNTVVVMSQYKMNDMLRAIDKFKVSHLFVVPPVVVELIKKEETVKEYNVSSLREILSGAAPLGKDLIEACTKIFPQAVVHQAYGMTETTGVISLENRRGTCSGGSAGALAPGVEAQIVDAATTRRLTPYHRGEIWVRGPVLMKGYLKNYRATMETIDEQGWLHTGDVGYFDDEGQLYVVDRVKELIKYKGFQVAPAELELLLLSHPQIVDAAVLGLNDDEAGEIPVAYVVRSSISSLTREEVHQYIAEQ
ncbi:AMP-dependent synthetase and ligase family protein, partial [Perilla frutescens var. hirtella]